MRREAKEETSLILEPVAILGAYSDPSRDPRMHAISVTFVTKIVIGHEVANDNAAAIERVNVADELDRLIETNQIAFDYAKILIDFKKWKKADQCCPRKILIFLHFGQQREEMQVQKRFSKSSHPIDRYRNIIYN